MKGALSAALLLALVAGSQGIPGQECCPGQRVLPRGYCPSTPERNTTERINIGCKNGHFMLRDIVVAKEGFSTRDTPGYIFTIDNGTYCVGQMQSAPGENTTVDVAVVCFTSSAEDDQRDIHINGILTLTSVVFLILTLAVYAFLPQLRDLQGKCIMCMCGSMALGFLSLSIMQIGYGYQEAICSLNGFLIYFWLMATFFWMNVVSINVLRSVTESSYLKKTESRQFMYYSLYAWGCTFAFLIIVLATNFVEGPHLSPGIGFNHNCWFSGTKETWVFFYGPMAALVATNILLFVLTSIQLWKHSKNYDVSALNRLRYKFLLYLKLFIVMGLSWIFEIASFAHAESHIVWRIADIFNCLQGLVFFLLLIVFRRRALLGLAERGIGGAAARRLLQKLNKNDEENDSIVESEDAAVAGAPFNVNLNN